MLPPLVVICGPTASGKTRISLELAERVPGAEIISADSRQVYRGMDIGTAKVEADVRERVPHHGLDLVDPDQPFTAADYRLAAMRALSEIGARGGLALLVGGTGLYLRAVARDVPLDEGGHDPDLRAELDARLARDGLEPLVAQLRALAPENARSIDLANPRRVVRALERASLLGDRPPPAPRGYPAASLWLGVDPPRPQHDRSIAARAEDEFQNGLLDEADRLRSRYAEDLRAFSAVGYREAFDVLAGRVTLDRAVAQTVTRTRQYARRQRTWFRGEPGIEWLDPQHVDLDELTSRVASLRDAPVGSRRSYAGGAGGPP